MTSFGPQVAQSVAGSTQAERVAARDLQRKRPEESRPKKARPADQVDIEVESVEALDAVRGLKGNEQEESGADRQRRGQGAAYGPGARPADPDASSIDLNA